MTPRGGSAPPNLPVAKDLFDFGPKKFRSLGPIFAQETERLPQIWRFLVKAATCMGSLENRNGEQDYTHDT